MPTKYAYEAERYSPCATGRSKIKLDLRSVSKGNLRIDMSYRRNQSTTRIKEVPATTLGITNRPNINIARVSKGLINSVSHSDLAKAFTQRHKPEDFHNEPKYDLKSDLYKRQVAWLKST